MSYARPASVLARRCLVLGALVGLQGLSHAATTLSQFPPNPGVLPGGGFKFTPGTTFGDPPPPRAWVNGTYGGVPGVKATDSLTLKGPAGNMAVQVSRTAGLSAVGAAAARCLGNPICVAASTVGAAVLSDAWDRLRVKPDGAGGLLHDPGTVEETVIATVWCHPSGNYGCHSSLQAAGNAVAAAFNAGRTESVCYKNGSQAPENTFRMVYNTFFTPTGANTGRLDTTVFNTACQQVVSEGSNTTYGVNQAQTTRCPASIDALNPAYNVPAGGAKGADGKCPTARYNHAPITPTAAGDLFNQYPPNNPVNAADVATKGGESIAADWGGITGPASQVGTPTTTTTTNPNGTTTTQTTTPTYNYNYGSDSITYSISNTTITNNAGDVTTTTTTVNPSNPQQDPENPCVQNPDASGCAPLGTPGAEPQPQRTTQGISYVPEVFATGTCPPPEAFSVFGWSNSISYEPLCSAAQTWVRGIVLLLATAVGALVFIGGLKS